MNSETQSAYDKALEDAANICDELGDAEFAFRTKRSNHGIAVIAQRHYMKCAIAIRNLKGKNTVGVELHCDDCQLPYVVWFAPSPIWNFVMGGPEAKDDPGGMLCPRCFTIRAENAGIKPTAWVVQPEEQDAANS